MFLLLSQVSNTAHFRKFLIQSSSVRRFLGSPLPLSKGKAGGEGSLGVFRSAPHLNPLPARGERRNALDRMLKLDYRVRDLCLCERNEHDKIHPCQSRKSKQPFTRCPTPISKRCRARSTKRKPSASIKHSIKPRNQESSIPG